MGFHDKFDEFDLLTGTPPHYPISLLPPIAKRARALLKARTRDEVVHAARNVDYFVEMYFRQELDNGPRAYDFELFCRFEDAPESEFYTSVDALKRCIGRYALEDDTDFPKGREYEYFAVHALSLVADAMVWLEWTLGPAPSFPGIRYKIAGVGKNAIMAMDAVCYAEQLHATEIQAEELAKLQAKLHQVGVRTEKLAEEKAKKKISVNARKAAIKRHAENRAMKKDVMAWCEKHLDEYPSMDSAAEAIAQKLVPLGFRTVRNHIAEYRKKVQSPRRL